LNDYANCIRDELVRNGIRVEADLRSEKLGFKIREAQLEKIPYMLIVGNREKDSNTVSVRLRGGEDLGAMQIEAIINRIVAEISQKQ